jgi:hypothetical protein
MYQRGARLMQSEHEDDWETAWDKYLGPLLEKDPDTPHREEIEQKFREQYEKATARRKARTASHFAGPMSEAQWFYQEGLRLRQQGDEAGAQRVWKALVRGFEEVKTEKPWVDLAKQELDKPSEKTVVSRQWVPVKDAVKRAQELRKEGKEKEASAILDGLKELYRGDKQAEAILKGE